MLWILTVICMCSALHAMNDNDFDDTQNMFEDIQTEREWIEYINAQAPILPLPQKEASESSEENYDADNEKECDADAQSIHSDEQLATPSKQLTGKSPAVLSQILEKSEKKKSNAKDSNSSSRPTQVTGTKRKNDHYDDADKYHAQCPFCKTQYAALRDQTNALQSHIKKKHSNKKITKQLINSAVTKPTKRYNMTAQCPECSYESTQKNCTLKTKWPLQHKLRSHMKNAHKKNYAKLYQHLSIKKISKNEKQLSDAEISDDSEYDEDESESESEAPTKKRLLVLYCPFEKRSHCEWKTSFETDTYNQKQASAMLKNNLYRHMKGTHWTKDLVNDHVDTMLKFDTIE